MSNNIYDILNKFNSVEQKDQPVQQQPKTKSKLAENMENVEGQLNEKYMGFKKTVAAVKKGGSADNPEAVAAAIGRKKYGKEKFQKAAAAGKKLGEEQGVSEGMQPGEYSRVLTALRLYYPRLSMEELNVPGYHKVIANKANVPVEYAADIINGFANPEDYWSDDKNDEQDVAEVAPPGAKAERMVKHIKKGYAKDGKLTDREKGIAYATAWKAHKAGKVEEAVAALSILSRSGMTAEQINEGWEDMMKAVKKQHDTEKGTGKFDKKKDPTTGGTVYTRKYNPKSGETDDTENVTAVKRGRGRPKKSAFESYLNKFADLIEAKDELGDFIKGLDNKGASARTAPTPSTSSTAEKPQTSSGKTQTLGTIKGGVWTADPPKPGEKGVPVPMPVDEQSSVTGTAPTSGYAKGIEAELNKKPTSSARPAPATRPATSAQPASQYNAAGDYQGINMGSLNDVPKKPTSSARPAQPASQYNALGDYQGINMSSLNDVPKKPAPTTAPATSTSQPASPTTQKPARVAGPDQSSAETARLQRYQSGAAARQKPAADQPAQEPSPDYNAMGDYQGMYMGSLGPSTPVKPQVPSGLPPVATKPNRPVKPVKPATVAKPPSGPAQSAIEIGGEEEARLAMQQQAEKEREYAANQDAEDQAMGQAMQANQGQFARPEPVKPAAQRTWKNRQGQDWKDASGNSWRQRSDNEIWWDNNNPGKPFPGEAEAQKAYDDRMSQGQKNWDAFKNFFRTGRGEKPAEKPLDLTPKGDSSFKPDPSQTVVEGIMTNELEEMMRLAGMEDVLKGKQHKLDKNKNGKLDATDFAMLRGEMDEDFAVKVSPPAQAGSAEQAKAIGAAIPAEPGKPDPFAKGEIVKPLKPMSFNPETGEIKANDMVFQPADKSMNEGPETCNECGYTMTECGCDSAMPGQDEGKMNVSMNVDSDGHQNITVSAEGEDAVKLAQLLKLAGLGSGSAEAVYQPVEVVVGDEEEIEEEKDERYHASTTPDVEVFGTDVQLKGGNGDVAGQEKKMRKHGYQFGDNPLAMKETVARDYESIKVRK